jgi:hypothetical protein
MPREVAATLQFSAAAILIQKGQDPIDPMARIKFASERLRCRRRTRSGQRVPCSSATPARLRRLDTVEAVSG